MLKRPAARTRPSVVPRSLTLSPRRASTTFLASPSSSSWTTSPWHLMARSTRTTCLHQASIRTNRLSQSRAVRPLRCGAVHQAHSFHSDHHALLGSLAGQLSTRPEVPHRLGVRITPLHCVRTSEIVDTMTVASSDSAKIAVLDGGPMDGTEHPIEDRCGRASRRDDRWSAAPVSANRRRSADSRRWDSADLSVERTVLRPEVARGDSRKLAVWAGGSPV